eukprot:CAMPEP_0204873282 /NCGR_PEP_ID=MMETSP1348-20121228/40242_1 /ASSEMBLY_ACC=CAM_ASM_000700 /TAXON_ID=215587 /ORGANISM="Aplanochytrium stocchinoi, Strain GSBS06" /LENGTH=37 /DNA_ID= /DNA_START= /DNA_END= /DNA_ORIENTATION=
MVIVETFFNHFFTNTDTENNDSIEPYVQNGWWDYAMT